jgi:hypothetical protein
VLIGNEGMKAIVYTIVFITVVVISVLGLDNRFDSCLLSFLCFPDVKVHSKEIVCGGRQRSNLSVCSQWPNARVFDSLLGFNGI